MLATKQRAPEEIKSAKIKRFMERMDKFNSEKYPDIYDKEEILAEDINEYDKEDELADLIVNVAISYIKGQSLPQKLAKAKALHDCAYYFADDPQKEERVRNILQDTDIMSILKEYH